MAGCSEQHKADSLPLSELRQVAECVTKGVELPAQLEDELEAKGVRVVRFDVGKGGAKGSEIAAVLSFEGRRIGISRAGKMEFFDNLQSVPSGDQ